ncbi:MAG TPA: hypothetical protein PLV17_06790 [Spirochaetota bacterium]|nr:hypothetical protein [Spirochaetota bacterium]
MMKLKCGLFLLAILFGINACSRDKDEICSFITSNNDSYYYTLPNLLPDEIVRQFSHGGNESIIKLNLNNNQKSSINQSGEYYLYYDDKIEQLDNFEYYLFNNGMYDVQCVGFYHPKIENPYESYLMTKSGYEAFKRLHKKKDISFNDKIWKEKINYSHEITNAEKQYKIDFNGDGNDDYLIIYKSYYNDTKYIKKYILKITNGSELSGFFGGLFYVSFHDYPMIKSNYTSDNSGEAYDYFLFFDKGSFKENKIIVNTSFSY